MGLFTVSDSNSSPLEILSIAQEKQIFWDVLGKNTCFIIFYFIFYLFIYFFYFFFLFLFLSFHVIYSGHYENTPIRFY